MSEHESENDHCLRPIAKVVYFAHLILNTLFTTYILIAYPRVISFTATFFMLLIYGYMLLWVLLLNCIFVVLYVVCRCARNRRRQFA